MTETTKQKICACGVSTLFLSGEINHIDDLHKMGASPETISKRLHLLDQYLSNLDESCGTNHSEQKKTITELAERTEKTGHTDWTFMPKLRNIETDVFENLKKCLRDEQQDSKEFVEALKEVFKGGPT